MNFPGKPKAGAEPVEYGKFRICTDMASLVYRIKTPGSGDRCTNFKQDPKGAWKQVCEFVGAV